MPFRAPVEDLRFALEVAGLPEVVAAGYPDADAETVAAVLEAAGAFATDVLAPLNRPATWPARASRTAGSSPRRALRKPTAPMPKAAGRPG